MNGTNYRAMTASDIRGVLDLHRECGLEPWTEASYREALNQPRSRLIVAENRCDLAGFISARLITSSELCEIFNICVSPLYRKQQIGAGLLSELFEQFPSQIRKVWLEVREGNSTAIIFYEKHGFKTVGMRKNFYRNPAEDGLLMEKVLD
jgi:ribosomal-protein-alanine N-acetyltransferase